MTIIVVKRSHSEWEQDDNGSRQQNNMIIFKGYNNSTNNRIVIIRVDLILLAPRSETKPISFSLKDTYELLFEDIQ